LIFCAWRASWLRLWPCRVLIFWKLWRHKQNFVLALKVLPQFPSVRRASFKSWSKLHTDRDRRWFFIFFRADAIFSFKPESSTLIVIGVLSLELRSQFHQFLFSEASVLELPKSVCNPIFRVA
jgi:hypothetical protein